MHHRETCQLFNFSRDTTSLKLSASHYDSYRLWFHNKSWNIESDKNETEEILISLLATNKHLESMKVCQVCVNTKHIAITWVIFFALIYIYIYIYIYLSVWVSVCVCKYIYIYIYIYILFFSDSVSIRFQSQFSLLLIFFFILI